MEFNLIIRYDRSIYRRAVNSFAVISQKDR